MNTRIRRLQLARGAFHITARTQGRVHWFTPQIRSHITRIIATEVNCTDAKLLALAVMPNHLHIVLIQGTITLGRIMQPILRRVALLVQRTHQIEGHVFERRFFSALCDTADYLREAIVYTHLNPYNAGLCRSPDGYEWTSHIALAGGECAWTEHLEVGTALALFAETPECGLREQRASYLQWVARRMESQAGPAAVQLCTEGNRVFTLRFSTTSTRQFAGPDLRDVALKGLRVLTNDYELKQLIGSRLPHRMAVVRRQLIAFLLVAGFRTGQISEFFAVAPSTVSKVAYQLKMRPDLW